MLLRKVRLRLMIKIVDEFWLQVVDEFEKIELAKNPSEEKEIGS